MVKTYLKTFSRTFRRHLTRLLSIALMVLISIGFSAGIGMATAAGLYGLAVVTTVLALAGLEIFGIILFSGRRRKAPPGKDRHDC